MNKLIDQKLAELFPQFSWGPVTSFGARLSVEAKLPDGRRIGGSITPPAINAEEVALFVARYFGRCAADFLEKETQLPAA